MRCQEATRPGVGVIHVHSRPWAPNRVVEVVYEPEGRPGVRHRVPESAWETVFQARSFEHAMAIIRAAENDGGEDRPVSR